MTMDPQVRAQAADWFARLRDEAAPESDWIALTAWLEADAAHLDAFEQVEAGWVDASKAEAARPPAVVVPIKAKPRRRATAPWAPAAIAASLLVTLGIGWAGLSLWRQPAAETFRTGPGETRTLALSDGSSATLNQASVLRVQFAHGRRHVALDQGEVLLDVAHDASRPFVVAAGAREVRVLGTRFDVRRSADDLQVGVARGRVAVAEAGRQIALLAPGDELHAGGGQPVRLGRRDAGEIGRWMQGELVYRDARLTDVAADLGGYVGAPVHVAPALASMRFSGVLRTADGPRMLQRLGAFLKVRTVKRSDGFTLSP